jgi:hypothetical protein
VLIRHLTGDPPGMAARATAALADEDDLLLTDLVTDGDVKGGRYVSGVVDLVVGRTPDARPFRRGGRRRH